MEIIEDHQCGFRRNRSTIDHIFCIRKILEKKLEYNRRERDHWGDLGVDGWIILGWISRRWDVVYGLDWVGSG